MPTGGVAPLFFFSLIALQAPGAAVGSAVDPAGDPVVVRDVAALDRVVAAAGAGIGGGAGGFVGGAVALGLSAALAAFDDRASLLPLVVLPPLFAGAGAFIVGTAVADSDVGLAGGAGAGGLCAVWSVVLGALLVSDPQGLLGDQTITFAATAVVPALVGVTGAAVAAPFFAPPLE